MVSKATIINGKEVADEILAALKEKINRDSEKGIAPAKLSIILVGNDNPASIIYVRNKIKAAARVGIDAELCHFNSDISEKELLTKIELLNKDENVSGMIVQLPLPKHIDKSKVIKSISPDKDVDGFHPVNVGRLFSPHDNGFVPCTALGCLRLIKKYYSNLSGKNVVVIGRSNIVGRPLAALLLKEDCTVTICHSRTVDLKSITKNADIVISAVGRPRFLTVDYFNESAMVIDVGMNREKNGNGFSLCGDVDFEHVKDYVKYITPVPKGVGPMTIACLLVNTYGAKFGFESI